MPYSVPSSTKIPTLATAPFFFILFGIMYVFEFAMVPGVYTLLCPQEEEVLFCLRAQMYRFNNTIIKKI